MCTAPLHCSHAICTPLTVRPPAPNPLQLRALRMCLPLPAQANQVNEVDEAIKSLKTNPGVESLIVVANSGIVIKHENMGYRQAVQHAALVLDLCDKSKKFVAGLLDPPDVRAQTR